MDFVLVAVNLHRVTGREIRAAGGQLEVGATQRAKARNLPAANHAIQELAGIAQNGLALTDRHVHNPVPRHAVLRNAGVPAIVQIVVACRIVRRHRTRQILVERINRHVIALAAGSEVVVHHVEHLVTVAFAIAALQFELDAIGVASAPIRPFFHAAVDLLIVGIRRHVGQITGG